MKKVLLSFAVVALFAACKSEPEAVEVPAVVEEAVVEVVDTTAAAEVVDSAAAAVEEAVAE